MVIAAGNIARRRRPIWRSIAGSASSPAECPPTTSYSRRAISRPCSGRGPPPKAVRSMAASSKKPGRTEPGAPGRRNTPARPAPSISALVCMKWSAASIHPGCGTAPARRNMSHGLRTPAAAALRRTPRVSVELSKRQPAISATSAVASREPASATTTSASRPEAAAGTSAESVGTRLRSEFRVEMIALSIGTTAGQFSCHHIMWRMAFTATR